MEVTSWVQLFESHFGRYSPVESERAFKTLLGITPFAAETLFLRYGTSEALSRKRLLFALYHLKGSATLSNKMSNEWRNDRFFKHKTQRAYKRHVLETIYYLQSVVEDEWFVKRLDGSIDDSVVRLRNKIRQFNVDGNSSENECDF